MWETTFPLNSHAGLGKTLRRYEHTHQYVTFVNWLAYPIRRGYLSEMLFPTWVMMMYRSKSQVCLSKSQNDNPKRTEQFGDQKIARFRTHLIYTNHRTHTKTHTYIRRMRSVLIITPRFYNTIASPQRTHTRTHTYIRRMGSVCNHHSKNLQHHRISPSHTHIHPTYAIRL